MIRSQQYIEIAHISLFSLILYWDTHLVCDFYHYQSVMRGVLRLRSVLCCGFVGL